MYVYMFFIQGNVTNDSILQPNASRTSNVTWQPSQHSEGIGTVRTFLLIFFYYIEL
jgi:hypothetical protein